MKKAKKILALVISIAMVASISVAATLAYLKASSTPVTNTFVVGNLFDKPHDKSDSLFIEEKEVDPVKDGYEFKSSAKYTKEGIEYKNLEKGNTIDKGVYITAKNFAVNAYVFVRITDTTTSDSTKKVQPTSDWVQVKDAGGTAIPGVYCCKDKILADESNKKERLEVFEKDEMAVTEYMETQGSTSIKVEMFACQANEFATADAAWAACFAE